MKRISLIIPLSLLILFAACDKISPDQYTVTPGGGSNGGGGGVWNNGSKVLVEKYTGPRCTNCPTADVTLDALHEQFGDQMIVIAINHPDGQGLPFPNQPDMRTDAGTEWDRWFGIDAIPAAYLNRIQTTQYSGSMNTIGNDIKTALEQDPAVDIDLSVNATDADLTIDVAVRILRDISSEVTLTLAVTEDSLVYKQTTPQGIDDEYVHNHILRDVITATWGDNINVSGRAGEVRYGTYHYNLGTVSGLVPQNSHIVAFASRKDDRTVLGSEEISLNTLFN